mgnify:FL=1|jgi:hypothetical protein
MTTILYIYGAILALAIWQEKHGRDETNGTGDKC